MNGSKRVKFLSEWSRDQKLVVLGLLVSVITAWIAVLTLDDAPESVRNEDLQLMVGVKTEYAEVEEADRDGAAEQTYSVDYRTETHRTVASPNVRIFYTSDYFSTIDSVGFAKKTGVFDDQHFFLPRIGIDVKVNNNGELPVFLERATIEVSHSEPDQQPLIVFPHQWGAVREIVIANEGWSEPTSMWLEAGIVDVRGNKLLRTYPLVGTKSSPGSSTYHFSIMPILRDFCGTTAPFADADTLSENATYRQKAAVWSQIYRECHRLRQYAITYEPPGIYAGDGNPDYPGYGEGEIIIALFGRLRWTWIDGDGKPRSNAMNIATRVQVSPPYGLGAPGFPPTGTYDVKLRVRGDRYSVDVRDFSQSVQPRGSDRFIFWVGADRSSQHRFTIKLYYNGGKEVSTVPIMLDYLMPRGNYAALRKD